MKYLFTFFILIQTQLCLAQIPPQRSDERMGYGSDAIVEEAGADNRRAGYFQKDGKYGFVINGKREEAVYDKIEHTQSGYIVNKNKLYGVVNHDGILTIPIQFDSIGNNSYVSGNAFIVKSKGRYGSLSPDGKIILRARYERLVFSDSRAPLSFVKSKSGSINAIRNADGKLFAKNVETADVYQNITTVKINGKYGAYKGGKLVLPFVYDTIYRTYVSSNAKERKSRMIQRVVNASLSTVAQYLIVRKDGKAGLVDSGGTVVYEPEFDEIFYGGSSLTNYYTVKKGSLIGAFFPSSEIKTSVDYQSIHPDGTTYLMTRRDGKSGVMNMKGDVVFPTEFSNVMLMSKGFKVGKDGQEGFFDLTGKELIPIAYEKLESFYDSGFSNFLKVSSKGSTGVVNLRNEMIVPVEYEDVYVENDYFMVVTAEPQRKFGIREISGKVVLPAEYQWITDSDTYQSPLLILKRNDSTYNFLNKDKKLVFTADISGFNYLHDGLGLISPKRANKHHRLVVHDKNDKSGLLDEMTGTLAASMKYDAILQKFETREHTYFKVRIGKKFGLIDEAGNIIIPVSYDGLRIDFLYPDMEEPARYSVVVAKGKKWGTVDLKNQQQVPFQYDDLRRIAGSSVYKARKGSNYSIISGNNRVIHPGPFNEVANFEHVAGNRGEYTLQALTFYNGKMRLIDGNGNFLSQPVPMEPHCGYETFEELKLALIAAMDDPKDDKLRDFANRIAPSGHLLFYLRENPRSGASLEYTDIQSVREKYLRDLLEFKRHQWRRQYGYDPKSLTHVADYTHYRDGFVTNLRYDDHAFGDTRFLEKVLRNCFKVNGFWISSYFLRSGF